MEQVSVMAAIVAIIAGLKEQYPQVEGKWTILLAALLGGVAGYLGLEGLTVTQGVVVGLSAVGAHTLITRVGREV